MRLLLLFAVGFLATTPSTIQAQVTCPKPVIPAAQKLDPSKVQDQPKDTADLPSVVASVKAAVACYQDNRGSGADVLPPLSSAVFDFKTTTGTVGGLSLNLFIVKIGGSVEKDTVNDVSFTYSVPTPPPTRGPRPKPQALSDALANEILAAAIAAKPSLTLLGMPLSKVTVSVQFGIKFDGNVSLNIPVSVVTLGPSADRNKTSTQSVTLTFGK
jgi:hypothetical protein